MILMRAKELRISAIPEAMLKKAELVTTVTASPDSYGSLRGRFHWVVFRLSSPLSLGVRNWLDVSKTVPYLSQKVKC